MRIVGMLLLFQSSSFFLNPLFSSYKLMKKISRVGRIDDSHNEKHGKEVLFWAIDILRHPGITKDPFKMRMAAQCALLHDALDHKYTVDFSSTVEDHLRMFHEQDEVDGMMKIMKTMSYSKIREHGFPDWIRTSPYEQLFHVVREADLLSSYNLARMVEYRQHLGGYTDAKIREEMMELYQERMGRLVERGFFLLPGSADRAKQLDAMARVKLRMLPTLSLRRDNLDILRTVNHLSLFRLVEELQMIIDGDRREGDLGAE